MIRRIHHTDFGVLIASAKCLDMSIELRLTVRDYFVQIPEANWPEKHHDTKEGEIVRIWQQQIAEAKMLDKYTQLRLTVAETIPSWFQANQPGDASVTKSVKVNCNEFIIRELEGYQSRHPWDLISYNPIEPIDDDRDDSRAYASTRVASPAIPEADPFSWDFINPYPTSAIEAGKSINRHLQCEPTENQSGFTRYGQFTSSDAPNGSAICDNLLPDSMESSTLRIMLEVYRRGYGRLTRLYTVSKLMN
jgi:hypothetical protein